MMEEKEKDKDIQISISMQDAMKLGVMMDDALRAAGMKHIEIASIIQQQIKAQLPAQTPETKKPLVKA